MIATRKASRAALTDVYEDLGLSVRMTARVFARQFRLSRTDREEAIALANLVFLEAYHTFRADLPGAVLGKRVRFMVWNRLHDAFSKEARYRKRVTPRRPSRHTPGAVGVRVFDRDDLMQQLTEDGRLVVGLLLSSPPDLDAEIRELPAPSPHVVRGVVREYLANYGWSWSRVTAAFRAITEVLP